MTLTRHWTATGQHCQQRATRLC